MNLSIRERKDETITVRCTKSEREKLERAAQKKGKTLSRNLLDCGIAGLERKRDKDRKRAEMLVIRQQQLNEEYRKLLDNVEDEKMLEMLKPLMEREQKLWEC